MKTLIAALLVALSSAAQADNDYQIRAVDFPGATNTFVFALNNAGHFVGAEIDAAGTNHAIYDDGRQLQLLELSGPATLNLGSLAFSINNHGDIAGAFTDTAGVQHGYLRHADGTLTQIDFPGASGTQAFGVNDRESSACTPTPRTPAMRSCCVPVITATRISPAGPRPALRRSASTTARRSWVSMSRRP